MSKASSDVIQNVIPAAGGMHSLKATLKEKQGAVSASITEVLTGIGISVGVLALVGAGVAYAMNWSQDSKAQGALDSVRSAQVAYQAQNEKFGTLEQLTTGDSPALTAAPDNVKITSTDTNYCAVAKSKSMIPQTYWVTAKSGKVLKSAPTAAEAGVACPTL